MRRRLSKYPHVKFLAQHGSPTANHIVTKSAGHDVISRLFFFGHVVVRRHGLSSRGLSCCQGSPGNVHVSAVQQLMRRRCYLSFLCINARVCCHPRREVGGAWIYGLTAALAETRLLESKIFTDFFKEDSFTDLF